MTKKLSAMPTLSLPLTMLRRVARAWGRGIVFAGGDIDALAKVEGQRPEGQRSKKTGKARGGDKVCKPR
jgi:hypothetical protein